MIDITKLQESFEQKKDVVIDLIIEQYGREYSEVIKDRLSNLLIDFSSLPDQEYSFLQSNSNQLNIKSKFLIQLRYSKYKQAKKTTLKGAMDLIIKYIEKNLSVKCSNLEDLAMFLNSDLGESYIDSLSSRSTQIINNTNLPESLKEVMLKNRAAFEKYQLSHNFCLSQQDIDKFIEYRNSVRNQYRIELTRKSKFCKNVFKDFVKRWETPIPVECFATIEFDHDDAYTSSFTVTDNKGNNIVVPYITIKYLNLKNKGAKSLDTIIIHEMIHAIELDPTRGIFGLKMQGISIMDEIKSQFLAVLIATELHELGIFILDNPNDYINQGQSAYEWLFPFTQEFLERNKKTILDCTVNYEPQKIAEHFGDIYKRFCIELDRIYMYFMIQYKQNRPVIAKDSDFELISGIIDEMEKYKKEHSSKEKTIV